MNFLIEGMGVCCELNHMLKFHSRQLKIVLSLIILAQVVVSIDLFFPSNCSFSYNGVYALDTKEQSVRDNNHTQSQ